MSSVFTIKVSDLLLHSGSHDTITLSSVFSTKLSTNTKGITVTLVLEHLNKNEILVTIEKGVAYFDSFCDRCGVSFEEKRKLENCVGKGTVGNLGGIEDVIIIDEKNLTLNIEDFLADQFILLSSLKILCKDCQKKPTLNKEESTPITGTIKREKKK